MLVFTYLDTGCRHRKPRHWTILSGSISACNRSVPTTVIKLEFHTDIKNPDTNDDLLSTWITKMTGNRIPHLLLGHTFDIKDSTLAVPWVALLWLPVRQMIRCVFMLSFWQKHCWHDTPDNDEDKGVCWYDARNLLCLQYPNHWISHNFYVNIDVKYHSESHQRIWVLYSSYTQANNNPRSKSCQNVMELLFKFPSQWGLIRIKIIKIQWPRCGVYFAQLKKRN